MRAGRYWIGVAVVVAALLAGGCQSKPKEPVWVARFHMETSPSLPAPWVQPMILPRSGVTIPVSRQPVLTEAELANVELVRVDLGLCLLFQFTESGARQLFGITGSNIGRRLVVAVNGQPVGVRVIDGPVSSGQWLTFTELDDEAITQMAVDLKASIQRLRKAAEREKLRR